VWKKISHEKFFLRNQINLDIHNKCTLECNKCGRFNILKSPDITLANFSGCPLTDIDHIKMKKYCDDLSKHRNFNWRELWNEY